LLLVLMCGCQPLDLRKDKDRSPRAETTASRSTNTVRVFFTTPSSTDRAALADDPASMIADSIAEARDTIDICAFELDNRVISEALAAAHRRGVRVRLVTDSDYAEEAGAKLLEDSGVPVVTDQRTALMHNKFIIIDDRTVWTGSMNFTENCAYKNNNNAIQIRDDRLAENYRTKFRWMFEEKAFGRPPTKSDRIPHPQLTLSDGTRLDNYFSTHDRCAQRVVQELAMAKKSIHFLAFSFTHPDIAQEMIDRAADGVAVQGVFEKTQAKGKSSQYERLQEAGFDVRLDGNGRNMHHKVIIIDGSTVLTGSFNFSKSAEKSNDENLLIVSNPEVARQYEAEFERVRAAATK
ncbi:MAG: phospholipase D-like domain-containing protein, partial [Gemmataceae bacterium]